MVTGEVERTLHWLSADGPVASILAAAVPTADAHFATVMSRDGMFRASIPLDALRLGRLRSGRLEVPDAPTRCWNVKDVASLHLTKDAVADSVEARQRRRS